MLYSTKYAQKYKYIGKKKSSKKQQVFLPLQLSVHLHSAYALQEEFGFKMNMLDIGGGFTGSELQLKEVRNVLEVERLLLIQEVGIFNSETTTNIGS